MLGTKQLKKLGNNLGHASCRVKTCHQNPEDQNTEYTGLLQNKRKLKTLIGVIFQLQQIKQNFIYPALFTDLA
jgi:hypothetical protein